MKILGYVIIAAVLLSSGYVFADKDATPKPLPSDTNLKPHTETRRSKTRNPLIVTSSSRNAMLEAMENPIAREAFHKAQLTMLQTPADALIHRYFTTDPIASVFYDQMKASSEAMLEAFSLHAKSNMLQLVRGLTPAYDNFDKLLVEVGIDSGLRKGIINHRELYLQPGNGAVNAATVSGSQDKMIVIVTDTLLASMSRKELAAVLAHEVGHTRAEHSIKGLANNFMMSLLAELFVNKNVGINQETAEMLDRLSNLNSSVCKGACGHGNHFAGLSRMMTDKNSLVGETIESTVANLQALPPEVLHKSITGYLSVLIQAGELENAPPQTIEYFRTLMSLVERIGTVTLQQQEFMDRTEEIALAVKRAQEKSADNMAGSLTRNLNSASADAKLMGSKFEAGDKETQERIFDQIKRQAEEVQKSTAKTNNFFEHVGTSHPALAHRTLRILNTFTYPSVLFANGFLRLLLIQESLANLEANGKEVLAMYKDQAKDVQGYIQSQLQEYKKTGANHRQIKNMKRDLLQEVQDAKNSDIAKFKEVSKARFVHETEIIKLIFDPKFPITAKRSPRFENTVQFLAVQREVKFTAAAQLRAQLESEKAKTENPLMAMMNQLQGAESITEQTEEALKKLDRALDLQDTFINKIKDRLLTESNKTQDAQAKGILNQRFSLLTRIQQATSTTQLEGIRGEATPRTVLTSGLRNIDNKIPVRINQGEPSLSPSAANNACLRLFN